MDDEIKIDISDYEPGIINIDDSTMSSTAYQYPTYSIGTSAGFNGTYSVSNGGAGVNGSFLTSTGSSGSGSTVWTTNNTSPYSIGNSSIGPNPGLKVTGDAEFEGKVMINGRNISEFMETISKRLAILQPDPAKLEHFAALKKAYEHYKTLEALCEIPKEEKE